MIKREGISFKINEPCIHGDYNFNDPPNFIDYLWYLIKLKRIIRFDIKSDIINKVGRVVIFKNSLRSLKIYHVDQDKKSNTIGLL